MTIIQDIPIVILTQQQLAQYTEPHLSDPEVFVMMPPLKLLRHVIDKMKNISDVLCIEANMVS